MMLRKLRLDRGWSQEQLARLSGLNIRTIQRIERGHNAGLESLKSLAAVFEIDISELNPLQEQPMKSQSPNDTAPVELSTEPPLSTTHTSNHSSNMNSNTRGKLIKLSIRFGLIITMLWVINLITFPAYLWAIFPTLGMGFVLLYVAASAFTPHDPNEQKLLDSIDLAMTGEDQKANKKI